MIGKRPVCYKYPAANLPGGIAQLGERRVRIAKARGSNPLTSTCMAATVAFCLPERRWT